MNQKGHTLVETMAASAIGAMVIASIATSMNVGTTIAKNNHARLLASSALMQQVETLRSTDFDTVLALGNTFTNTQVTSLPGGSGTLAIANDFNSTDIRKVTATVSWTADGGRPMSSSITTLISRKGLNAK